MQRPLTENEVIIVKEILKMRNKDILPYLREAYVHCKSVIGDKKLFEEANNEETGKSNILRIIISDVSFNC